MLLTEPKGELRCRVTLIDNDPLLLVSTKVNIDEEERWVGFIEVIFFIAFAFALSLALAIVTILVLIFTLIHFFFFLVLLLLQGRQWLTIWHISISIHGMFW